jgi:dihydrofolate reductase
MILSLIAATGKNGELGKDNKLLWNLPSDMKHFREMTSGHPVIMGRKTFESIGHPLPKRRNIIITRDTTYTHEGVEIVHSTEQALSLFTNSDEEIFCIGGAEIYNLLFNKADKLYITEVDQEFEADAFFPRIHEDTWQEISRDPHETDSDHMAPYSFVTYVRIAK